MDKVYRRFFMAVSIVTVIVFVLGSIYWFGTFRDHSLNQKENGHLIGMSYMTMNNQFYEILNAEIEERVESEGDLMILRDPALNSERQAEQINNMLDDGIDALIVTPVDWQEIVPVLQRAKEKGVIVIVVDSDASDDTLADCTITSDNYDAGVKAAEYAIQQGGEKRFVIMTHNAAKSGIDRVRGFKDTIAGHDNISVVKEVECEGQLELAEPAMKEIIESGISFNAVFALNDLAGVGAVAALEEKGLVGKVDVYGVDASPDTKAMIKENIMTASAAQFPSEIGMTAADTLYRLLNGEKCEKQILVPVELVTRDNVERYGVDRWQ